MNIINKKSIIGDKPTWTVASVNALYELPFIDLIQQAQSIYRNNFIPNTIQISKLLSIKTGVCPEDCAYCPQSAHYQTNIAKYKLLGVEEVITAAKLAKKEGATRFCMGAAWRAPPEKALPVISKMIAAVKKLKLETCVTLGMLNKHQALFLKETGLDYYNHNLDTSPEYYKKIISTRTYQDRIETIKNIQQVGIKLCCGGIIGMGETRTDRLQLLLQLANLPIQPKSVPFNRLIKIVGTPLEDASPIDNFEFVRTLAVARVLLPQSFIRLSAGREDMSEEFQALCFLAGVNSIFCGDKLLTAPNAKYSKDEQLLQKLGIRVLESNVA